MPSVVEFLSMALQVRRTEVPILLSRYMHNMKNKLNISSYAYVNFYLSLLQSMSVKANMYQYTAVLTFNFVSS